MSSNFKMDILLNSVKGLQQEKSCLEQKIRSLRVKHASLEKTRESLKTKLTQTKDVNAKMNATLKVAQHKVTESQTQLKSQQHAVTQMSTKVDNLKSEMNRAKSERLKETIQFETFLSDLTTKFQSARDLYKDENLTQEIMKNNSNLTTIGENAVSVKNEKEQLIHDLEALSIDGDTAEKVAEQKSLPASVQILLLSMADDDITSRKKCHHRVSEKLGEIERELAA